VAAWEGEVVAIVPRWEWRTFGPGTLVAEPHLAALEATGDQESDETYLLREGDEPPTATVKLRGGLLDVKQLVATDEWGLQQWIPVLKAELPVDAGTVRRVWGLLGCDAPAPERDAYTDRQLLDELTGPGSGVRPVAVHKRRVRYRINGCTSELSDVAVDGVTTRTFAIESEDAGAVIEGVRSVGVAAFVNTAYPAGLAWLLGGTAERFAVVDCGTNSVKFHVAERLPPGAWRTIADRAEMTRLGEGLTEGGDIGEAPLERTVAAIAGMVAEARRHGALAVFGDGTAAFRIARNREAAIGTIARRTGLHLEVLSGEDEARLAFLAVKAGIGLGEGTLAVFDTGGGSTQLTFGHGDTVDDRFSVNVGAVRYTERFGLDGVVPEGTLREALAAIGADLARLDGRRPVDALVGMGGAITNITAVKHGLATYDPDRVQGTVLDRAEIDRQIERYRTTPLEARRSITGLQPSRAEVILAGACIVRTVMDKLGSASLTVSDRGLRHGLLIDRLGAVPIPRRNHGHA
jgi:exopolyphosphatase/guanosine-5'-triphosphate,3'-diphosphate pyrophosphatase